MNTHRAITSTPMPEAWHHVSNARELVTLYLEVEEWLTDRFLYEAETAGLSEQGLMSPTQVYAVWESWYNSVHSALRLWFDQSTDGDEIDWTVIANTLDPLPCRMLLLSGQQMLRVDHLNFKKEYTA